MMADLLAELRQKLPAGEWLEIEPQNTSPSLMTDYKCLFARAKWIKHGSRQVFLKCIWPADETAGDLTRELISPDRLRQLEKRLKRIQDRQSDVPIVPIYDVRILSGDVLVITMAEVQTIREKLDRGQGSVELAKQILSDLSINYSSTEMAWIHFDVCPKNVGCLADGTVRLIDVESCYLAEGDEEGFPISQYIAKWHLQPRQILDAIKGDAAEPERVLSLGTAIRKYEYEVALVAAEVSLNHSPDFSGVSYSPEEWVVPWLESQRARNDKLVNFWLRYLCSWEGTFGNLDLQALAHELEEVGYATAEPEGRLTSIEQSQSSGVSHKSAELKKNDPELDAMMMIEPVESFEEFAVEWNALRKKAADLRNERLMPAELEYYRTQLIALVERFPKRREIWIEILLLEVGYRRDKPGAYEIAKKAVRELPEDSDLQRLYRIIEMLQAR